MTRARATTEQGTMNSRSRKYEVVVLVMLLLVLGLTLVESSEDIPRPPTGTTNRPQQRSTIVPQRKPMVPISSLRRNVTKVAAATPTWRNATKAAAALPAVPAVPAVRKLSPGHGDLYPSKPDISDAAGLFPARVYGPDYLIWQEEFDTLDLSVWEHMVTAWRGGNKEFQYYRNDRRNSYVQDGVLYLAPTLTANEYGDRFLYNGSVSMPGCNHKPCESASGQDIVLPVMSARIRTLRSFGFRYGRVEVRAQLPRGDWLWPAIWMKPVENYYGGWPASGEIDLVEARGNRRLRTSKGVSMGIDRMSSTLHYGPNATYNIWRPTHWELSMEKSGSDFANDFHLFGLEWTRHSLTFSVDNEVIGTMTPPSGGFWKIGGFDKNPGGRNIWENGEYLAPFDREFFLVLNVAVGGTFFPDGWRNEPHPRPWSWDSPHPVRDFWERRKWWLPTWNQRDSALKVDYIRVFSLPSP